MPEAPSIQAEAIIGEGGQAKEMAPREAGAPEVDMVSISSDESPEVCEPPCAGLEVVDRAESSRAGGSSALVRMGLDPLWWGGPRVT